MIVKSKHAVRVTADKQIKATVSASRNAGGDIYVEVVLASPKEPAVTIRMREYFALALCGNIRVAVASQLPQRIQEPPAGWRNPGHPPDEGTTVCLRLDHNDWPIVMGFKVGAIWRDTSNRQIHVAVLGWMHLDEAARFLDQLR